MRQCTRKIAFITYHNIENDLKYDVIKLFVRMISTIVKNILKVAMHVMVIFLCGINTTAYSSAGIQTYDLLNTSLFP